MELLIVSYSAIVGFLAFCCGVGVKQYNMSDDARFGLTNSDVIIACLFWPITIIVMCGAKFGSWVKK